MPTGTIQPYTNVSPVSFAFWGSPVLQQSDGTLWCPGFDGPTFADRPWDYVKVATSYGPSVGGVPPDRTPGIARVVPRKEFSADKKKAAGAHGARYTFHGLDPAEFFIELRLWTPEQLRQLQAMWSDLFVPAAKGSPLAFDVTHPAFDIHAIKSVQFAGGEGPEIGPDRVGIFRIRVIEFLPPAKSNATKTNVAPIGSRLDPGANPTPGSNPANLGPQ